MCYALKYGIWNVAKIEAENVNALVRAGYAPLTAMVLSSRGIVDEKQAQQYLGCGDFLPDPFLLTDMVPAVERLRAAIACGQRIAVFGDYDVDGITATCLLTDFLREQGADCVPYIPARLEEGYGLNSLAINQLAQHGVKLIVTVDCGITAVEEAFLCREKGIDLIITDHHECKETLPDAVAVIDPHRPDGGYPHKNLSGVGVAFKLAAALCGNQRQVLEKYSDLVCLGTVADVMLLQGENRRFVIEGLMQMKTAPRTGIAALMKACGCNGQDLSASSVGYVLAPRINAAGRMGEIHLAVELFLTKDKRQAEALASGLCELNRQRQIVETTIYEQAIEMLPAEKLPEAVVLADDTWHQGVVGIVASRIAEECCCPAVLICLDGEHGKASSRSYGGFNLFAALKENAHLLESYGGHELAAGFTILREKIGAFREALCATAERYYAEAGEATALSGDCVITPELLTISNIDALKVLEPCGSGCPKPLFVMENLTVERISQVGSGKHMRLRVRSGRYSFQAIYFSATAETACICPGETVDIAFTAQVNEYRGERSVQMNVVDIRPSCKAECPSQTDSYRALCNGTLTAADAEKLLPERETQGLIWRYLAAHKGLIKETPMSLCRKIVRWSGKSLSLQKLLVTLDIFADVGLLTRNRQHKYILLQANSVAEKTDLNLSPTMQRLLRAKES
ncbi:MAG: single-stranded-DNA-specific exonuclease RecJ [Ruminococcaceae bacterium]|nr:single-stranded-DNA-specific exonuclease RecJ [Oscillospiraceae bacterium]